MNIVGKVTDFLVIETNEPKIIQVETVQVKYSPGIVDSSDNYAVTVNGNIDLMVSEEDLDLLIDDLDK